MYRHLRNCRVCRFRGSFGFPISIRLTAKVGSQNEIFSIPYFNIEDKLSSPLGATQTNVVDKADGYGKSLLIINFQQRLSNISFGTISNKANIIETTQ